MARGNEGRFLSLLRIQNNLLLLLPWCNRIHRGALASLPYGKSSKRSMRNCISVDATYLNRFVQKQALWQYTSKTQDPRQVSQVTFNAAGNVGELDLDRDVLLFSRGRNVSCKDSRMNLSQRGSGKWNGGKFREI